MLRAETHTSMCVLQGVAQELRRALTLHSLVLIKD